MLNPSVSYASSQPLAPPSYDSVVRVDEEARFNQAVTTSIHGIDAFISSAVSEFNCEPAKIAKELARYLISRYSLSETQVPTISTAPKNPTDPNDWEWNRWEEKHYKHWGDYYSFKSDDVQRNVHFAFGKHLIKRDLEKYKQIMLTMEIGMPSTVYDCDSGYDLAQVFYQGLKSITPFIQNCIQAGLLTKEFINELYYIS